MPRVMVQPLAASRSPRSVSSESAGLGVGLGVGVADEDEDAVNLLAFAAMTRDAEEALVAGDHSNVGSGLAAAE